MFIQVMASTLKKMCFTLNNYTPEEEQIIRDYIQAKALFGVYGHEVGEGGTPHLQGYINFHRSMSFKSVKKLLPRIHLEKAKGTDEQNLHYCSKQDTKPFVHGTPQYSGKRNDLHDLCRVALTGRLLPQVARDYPTAYVKYHKGILSLVDLMRDPRDINDPPTVLWLWGPSGVGKTRYAYDHLPPDQIYVKDGTQWWDGYTQQQCILIDDFDGKWPFRDFLRLLDRYPYQGQTKGGYVKINSPIIIITCDQSPQVFWREHELQQLERRLTVVAHME